MPAVVKCPTCGTEVAWVPDNKFRPFCSERCKQIDLGAWASEKYVIGGKPGESPAGPPDDEDD
ncbi:DNA gyrase inhibitor YacG [Cupriavidus taiwanensis]|uniref:DNA gyrase inhibitor YacG n=1 Tax=Cupriavidus taiwanensis (strain DSM 17343 / BCRC 17206 / CCUG 44338 / CIP 107171 / LMG 19424 / R1) TaxID=977880 RepID=B3R8A9_CUPTR|nr:DNA gyrase inhibitor YacG [Cupriavidus taiwanensis]CAQ70645.1 conserved hypothetical protein, DUF329 [Cupriavidus taiwanensis LMG 19424]